MTVAATFEVDPVTVALRAWLEAAVLTGAPGEAACPIGDSQAPLDDDERPLPTPYGVLYQLPGVRTVPPFAGASELRGRWQVTWVADTPSLARHWADRGRKAIAGETDSGVLANQMTLAGTGVAVLARRSLDDGSLDLVDRLWQWSETFELDLSPA